jgi:bifunctional DNase/RNase
MKYACTAILAASLLCMTGCRKPSPEPSAAGGVKAPDLPSLVRMNAETVLYDLEARGWVIYVKGVDQKDAETRISIIVGDREASVLRMKLARQASVRPLTHDLTMTLLSAVGGTIKHVVVEDIQEGIFLARVYVEDKQGMLHAVDSRASDAIILAVCADVDLHFARKVVDEVGVKPEPDEPPRSLI